jgi:hypothetical protein
MVFVFGDGMVDSPRVPTWRVGASDWAGMIAPVSIQLGALRPAQSPFGPLAAAALAAGEVFKYVIRRLSLRDSYNLRYLAVAPYAQFDFGAGTFTPSINLGSLGVISAGAISQAAMFTLFRMPNVQASCYVVDDDTTELSNLNRNVLSINDDINSLKVEAIKRRAPSGFNIRSIAERFPNGGSNPLLTERIIVGVDDIPSRWAVQQQRPRWLGVGGTTHFEVSCSSHTLEEACAGCLHPRDDTTAGRIPTVSFVSFWAGLSLAARLVRDVIDRPYKRNQQHLWLCPLRMDTEGRRWWPVAPRSDCPVKCQASRFRTSAA